MATVVEFDSPATFLFRGGKVVPFPTEAKDIGGKDIREGCLLLGEGDIIVAVSDCVIHAGIGGLLRLGWDWPGIAAELATHCSPDDDAETIANHILDCCHGYDLGQPGDDSTVAVIKLRRPRNLTLFTGPPANRDMDEQIVKRIMGGCGKKVIAGGTTANIVSSRLLNLPLKVDLEYRTRRSPIAHRRLRPRYRGCAYPYRRHRPPARPRQTARLHRRTAPPFWLAAAGGRHDRHHCRHRRQPAHRIPISPPRSTSRLSTRQTASRPGCLGKRVTVEWV
jgi:hypothetical protein